MKKQQEQIFVESHWLDQIEDEIREAAILECDREAYINSRFWSEIVTDYQRKKLLGKISPGSLQKLEEIYSEQFSSRRP